MKLSEAIRLGAMMHPQYFGDFYGSEQQTCALGAAGDAIGATFVDVEEVIAHWPWLETLVCCPADPCEWSTRHSQVSQLIPHLNDDHHWTRERIADWVETIEQRHEEPQSLAAVDPVLANSVEPSTREKASS